MTNTDYNVDKIVVKYNEKSNVPYIVFFVLFIMLNIYILSNADSTLFDIIISYVILFIYICIWSKDAYVMKFSKTGCEVSTLFLKRKYSWNEIDKVKYEYYCQYKYERGKCNSIPNLKSCIVFEYFIDSKPEWREPYIAQSVFKPFDIFYVNFEFEGNMKNNYNYIIDEKYFLSKLEEWGVKVEGLNDPPKPYKKK